MFYDAYMKHSYEFDGKVWKDPAANWYFVSLDKKLFREIKQNPDAKVNRYGLVKIKATVGNTTWDSTLFPSKYGNYVFAIKSVVRKKEKIEKESTLHFTINL